MNPLHSDAILHYYPLKDLMHEPIFDDPDFAWDHLLYFLGTRSLRREEEVDYKEVLLDPLRYHRVLSFPLVLEKFWEKNLWMWILAPLEEGSLEVTKFLLKRVYEGAPPYSDDIFLDEVLRLFEEISEIYTPNLDLFAYILEFTQREFKVIKEFSFPGEEPNFSKFLAKFFKAQTEPEKIDNLDFELLQKKLRVSLKFGLDPERYLGVISYYPNKFNLIFIRFLVEEGYEEIFSRGVILKAYSQRKFEKILKYLLRRIEYPVKTIELTLRALLREVRSENIVCLLESLHEARPNFEFFDPLSIASEVLYNSPLSLERFLSLGFVDPRSILKDLYEALWEFGSIDPSQARRVLERYGDPPEGSILGKESYDTDGWG